MYSDQVIAGIFFVAGSSFVLLLYLVVGSRRTRIDERLSQLNDDESAFTPSAPAIDPVADFAKSTLPKMGAVLVPKTEEERTKLQTRLVHAGLYSRQAMVMFLGVKMALVLAPAFLGFAGGIVGLWPLQQGVVFGALAGAFGLVGPSFWLDRRKAERQTLFRRGLPDALDVLIICIEGGGSLTSAIRRVSEELRTAHPKLAFELNIVQREVQLGRSAGEALRQFADRADLEELRGLASVILQTEKFGASLVKALRVHADTMRNRRILFAEELAQKAVVKLLIPTVLFIMPALFIAVLGPLALHVSEIMETVNAKKQ